MTRSMIIWVAIALLPAAAGANPKITFNAANKGINPFTKGPLTRTWKWTCSDTAKVFPLKARCRVYDVTKGNLGSGKEVKLSDVPCGTSYKNPLKVTYTYKVPGAKGDHRYAYVAHCVDAKDCGGETGELFWYDITPPVSTIHSGPAKGSSPSTATFTVSCTDNSFSLKTPPPAPLFGCGNYVRLVDTDTNLVVKPTSMIGISTYPHRKFKVTYTGLPKGNYRFDTQADDDAGNVGQTKSWSFGPGKLDAGVKQDSGGKQDAGGKLDIGGKKDSGVKLDIGGKKDSGAKLDIGGKKDSGAKLDIGGKKDSGAKLDIGGKKDANKDVIGGLDVGGGKKDSGKNKDAGNKKDAGANKDSGAKKDAGDKNKDSGGKKDSGKKKDDGGVSDGLVGDDFQESPDSGGPSDKPGDGGDDGGGGEKGDTSGCDCSVSDAPGGSLVIILVLGLALLRRRRRA